MKIILYLKCEIYTVYRGSCSIARSWLNTFRTYTSKATKEQDTVGTSPANAKIDSQSVDVVPDSVDFQMEFKKLKEKFDALEGRMEMELNSIRHINEIRLNAQRFRLESQMDEKLKSLETCLRTELDLQKAKLIILIILGFAVLKFHLKRECFILKN